MNYPLGQGIHGLNKRANEQTPASQQQGKPISILRASQLALSFLAEAFGAAFESSDHGRDVTLTWENGKTAQFAEGSIGCSHLPHGAGHY